jgi:nucleoside 2-deoxyribosyltransferase
VKVYVAARYPQIKQAQAAEAILQREGHETTARWTDPAKQAGLGLSQRAVMDLEDVELADALLLLSEREGTLVSGGGRHFEMGYALALGKRVVVAGEHEHIFCYHPSVTVCPTVTTAASYLREFG